MFRKKDLLLILPCLILSAALFLWFYWQPSSAGIAVVEKEGREVYRIDLGKQSSTQILNIGGKMNVQLKVQPGAIFFYQSDCPDKVCIRTGKLTKPGQTAVCLPGRVSVKIISGKPTNKAYDGFTE